MFNVLSFDKYGRPMYYIMDDELHGISLWKRDGDSGSMLVKNAPAKYRKTLETAKAGYEQ